MPGLNPIDRRTFLIRGGGVLGAAALGAPSLLRKSSGITRIAERLTPEIRVTPKIKMGGTFRVGSLGSIEDTINAQHNETNIDQERVVQLYEGLTFISEATPYTYELALAEEIELSSNCLVGTVRLKKGLEFHNGKTITADDLIFTMQRELTTLDGGPGHGTAGFAAFNPDGMVKLDNYTVRFNLKSPDAWFANRFGQVVPVGYNPAAPVGAGPFMYKSFTPGSQSTFVRFPNYFLSPQPYLDEIQIIDFADDQSRMSALQSGEIDGVDGINTSLLGQSDKSSFTALIAKAGYYQPITMRVDMAPFNDARVRQAMRLIVNRQQMVEQAYGGYARIANDMPDPADPAYPALPQREQDIAEAKSLLKAAGYQNLKVTMTIAPQDNDIVNSAQVFAEQASAAGVTVNLTNLTNAAYQVGFTKWPFTQGYWAAGLLGTNYSGRFLPTSTNNDSHWDNAQTNEWYYEQVKTSNPAVRNELLTKIFKVFYDEGPDIIHTFKYNVDVYSSKFTGFVPNDTGGLSFSQYRFRLAQLA